MLFRRNKRFLRVAESVCHEDAELHCTPDEKTKNRTWARAHRHSDPPMNTAEMIRGENMSNNVIIDAVRRHIDTVLELGADRWRVPPSPLLADSIDLKAGICVPAADGTVSSNLSSQQNFLRALSLYGRLTGRREYHARAVNIYKYHFSELLLPTGLFRWGGHRAVDLRNLCDIGDKQRRHELKNTFPFYELMFEADALRADEFIRAFWRGHIKSWTPLEMNRHDVGADSSRMNLWPAFAGPFRPLRPRDGLSFLNTGNDLMFAALAEYRMAGSKAALRWGKRLFNAYMSCRNKDTCLGAYMFSVPKKKKQTNDPGVTESCYGDRAKRQLGPELGAAAFEANILLAHECESIYAVLPQIAAFYAQCGVAGGQRMIGQAGSGLAAWVSWAYVDSDNSFRPMLADGQDLTGFVPARPGYYAAEAFASFTADGRYLLSILKTALLLKDETLWNTARRIAAALDLGDIGAPFGVGAALRRDSRCDSVPAAMAMLEVYACLNGPFLNMAERIANNILARQTQCGVFPLADSEGSPYIREEVTRIDSQAPLMLLSVAGALEKSSVDLPMTVFV